MTTYQNGGQYPLVLARDYLNLLTQYKDIPNIRAPAQVPTPKKNKPKEGFWKTLFCVKTLINVWVPTIMTVAGTLGGAVLGAKYSTPAEPHKHKPKIEKREEHLPVLTNNMTYVYTNPNYTNIQFAVIGQKGEVPKGYWITTNIQGLKEVAEAAQADQVVLEKE